MYAMTPGVYWRSTLSKFGQMHKGQCNTQKVIMNKPRATLCVFSHAKIEITSSEGVHCTR